MLGTSKSFQLYTILFFTSRNRYSFFWINVLQINHTYEERRLLVAQSCGLLAEFVRPEIRDSLILSIVQQLIEDSATVVREAAAHNLALLLPLFPNVDKYFKVSLTKYASRLMEKNSDLTGLAAM